MSWIGEVNASKFVCDDQVSREKKALSEINHV